MAEDIRLSTSLFQHPKFLKLERKFGADGCLALLKLWAWVAEARPDGDLSGLTPEDLELAIGWKGPDGFISVLVELRFLDGAPSRYCVHGWIERQPFVSTRPNRVERARRSAEARWAGATPEERARVGRQLVDARRAKELTASSTCSTHVPSTSETPDNVPTTCDAHVSNVPSTHARTPRTHPRAKEGAPKNGAQAAQIKMRSSPSAFAGSHLVVSIKQDQLLADAFPWIDRAGEYRKADAWLEANPKRRPRRLPAFIQNWFSKVPAPSSGGKGGNRAEERTRSNLAAAGFKTN